MTALKRLPAVAREILERGDRNRNRLTADEREGIAAMLLETGIRGGQVLEWMAKLVRFRLGVGARPSPLVALSAGDTYAAELASERAEAIAGLVLDAPRAAA